MSVKFFRQRSEDSSLSLRRVWWLALLGPIVGTVQLIRTPVPIQHRPAREVGAYYQSLSFARDGLGSFFYLTPSETYSSLHLYSLLSSPFAAVGYPSGGRLVSLAAAVVAAALLAVVARHLFGRRVAVLAPAVLWIHPLFYRFSFGYLPEAVSIALTTGAVVALLFALDQGRPGWWYGVSLLLVVLAITNHLWEAVIGLPLFALAAYHRRYGYATALCTVVAATVGTVWAIRRVIGPVPDSQLIHWSILHADPGVYLTSSWWLSHYAPRPTPIVITLTLPAAIICFVYWSWLALRTPTEGRVLIASWLLSGIVLVVALPLGFMPHDYYLWAVLAPLAVSIAAGLHRVADATTLGTTDSAITVIVVCLVAGAVLNGLVIETAVLSGSAVPLVNQFDGQIQSTDGLTPDRAVELGHAIQESDASTPADVVFVGDWERGYYNAHGQVMVYSDLLMKGWADPRYENRERQGKWSPRFAESRDVSDCEVMVVKTDDGARIEAC